MTLTSHVPGVTGPRFDLDGGFGTKYPAPTISGYRLNLTCARCGAPVVHVADGRPVAGTEASAIADCAGCGSTWQILVHLRRVMSSEGNDRRVRATERKRNQRARDEARS